MPLMKKLLACTLYRAAAQSVSCLSSPFTEPDLFKMKEDKRTEIIIGNQCGALGGHHILVRSSQVDITGSRERPLGE